MHIYKKILIFGVSALSISSLALSNGSSAFANQNLGLQATYHLTNNQGWSNDLQTISWNDQGKYYDIYFLQSRDGADDPFGPQGQNWAHVTTKDFVTYSGQNDAIAANGGHRTEGWKSAWTGSVITNDGTIKGAPKGAKVAYFSGLHKANGKQSIWAAYSTDNGKTFTKPLNNGRPVATWDLATNKNDFRDPAVYYWNGKLMMYVAEGDEIGTYQSRDGINWSRADMNDASKTGAGTFFRGRSWDGNAPVECPVIKLMKMPNGKTKHVLFFGAKDASKGETTGTYYIVGHLDQNGLFAEETDVKRLDQGSDFYGANFTGGENLNQVSSNVKALGWVGNWNYTAAGIHADEGATSDYLETLGSYSLARDLTLDNDLTVASKIVNVDKRASSSKIYKNVTKQQPVTLSKKENVDRRDSNGNVYTLYDIPNQSSSQKFELNFKNNRGYKGRIYIDIWQGNDYVRFNYDPSNGMYNVKTRAGELDRSKNGQIASSYYFDGLLGAGNGYLNQSGHKNWTNSTLKVYTDKTSVEFEFPNGQIYTVARYNNSSKQDFKIFTEDPTNGNLVDIVVKDVK